MEIRETGYERLQSMNMKHHKSFYKNGIISEISKKILHEQRNKKKWNNNGQGRTGKDHYQGWNTKNKKYQNNFRKMKLFPKYE